MLTINYIKENQDKLVDLLKIKNFVAEELVKEIISLDAKRRSQKAESDNKLAEMNSLSKQIGMLYKEGKQEEANKIKKQTTDLKEEIKQIQEDLNKVETEFNDRIVLSPNVPNKIVPPGKSDEDNKIIETGDFQLDADTSKLPHWELAKKYDIIDFDLGVKITGAGFPVYKGKGARLQRGLINFFLDEASKAGYNEIIPPLMVNEASAFGTGQLPDKEGQMYHVIEDNLYLIPTAEVPVTNIFRDVILSSEDFPIKSTAYTPCFRREAGSYGKDVRGLNRLHQFDKVEMVVFCKPEESQKMHDFMVSVEEEVWQDLKIPYNKLNVCS